jgi:hypothetical protein
MEVANISSFSGWHLLCRKLVILCTSALHEENIAAAADLKFTLINVICLFFLENKP